MEKRTYTASEYRAYVSAVILLLCRAVADVVDYNASRSCFVDYTIGNSYFVRNKSGKAFDQELLNRIRERMLAYCNTGARVETIHFPREEAIKLMKEEKLDEIARLFRYRRGGGINLRSLNGYYDYYYGPCLEELAQIGSFDLVAGKGGFFLVLPAREDMDTLIPYQPRPRLEATLEETHQWYEQVGIETVSDLNDKICEGNISDLILVQEAEQERKIAQIAQMIAAREGVRFVMIAGPSSSGKTTFSHRLSIQLRTIGKKPHPIALDDYFLNRKDTPLDEEGKPDYECLEALDVELFNQDMIALLSGREVELPTFNFITGCREYNGKRLKLGPDDILVLEGIHGLNDKLSYTLPSESKFKIYISALTSLNVDSHNRIPSTDNRTIRRIVRDAATRGMDASYTIQMWPSVRRGEEQYIFPFQEEADVMFNSALVYELSVLKQFAEPLLFRIGPEDLSYNEAARLLKFLDYFLGVSSEKLPGNSICREFVGGSCFQI
ncbi:MAG: nucleoside kinase [Lachnospiraceae bacterium]|nr:nucleoside kinase [Lachnospiraceae bacterium]